MSTTTQAAAASLPSVPLPTPDATAVSLENAPSTSAAPGTTSHPPSAEPITGLTPDQVLQELQKSGFVDQLRRQMYDAFSSPPASAPVIASTKIDGAASLTPAPVSGEAQAGQSNPNPDPAASASIPSATPFAVASKDPASTSVPSLTASIPPASPPQLDVGTRSALLQFLASPLRAHLERQHGNLRLASFRDQTTTLMQLLESEPVDHPQRAELGEASVYDLLLRHVVMPPTAGEGGTAGMLDRNGRFGCEAQARINETIAELMHPTAKVDDEDDDEDEEGGAQPESTRTMDE